MNTSPQWILWQKLQENGLKAYSEAPEASCAVRGSGVTQAWRDFLKFKPGMRLLDVGCGCVGTPAYLEGWQGVSIYGIDPLCLPKAKWDGMIFQQGLAERLPYPDKYFDVVMFATSLDHIVDQKTALLEAKRCLKKSGSVLIWLGLPAKVPNTKPSWIIKLKRKLIPLPPPPETPTAPRVKEHWEEVNDTLIVPEGAIDLFHFRHDDKAEILSLLKSVGFRQKRAKVYREGLNRSLFLAACVAAGVK